MRDSKLAGVLKDMRATRLKSVLSCAKKGKKLGGNGESSKFVLASLDFSRDYGKTFQKPKEDVRLWSGHIACNNMDTFFQDKVLELNLDSEVTYGDRSQ